jgi:hypothetical protein
MHGGKETLSKHHSNFAIKPRNAAFYILKLYRVRALAFRKWLIVQAVLLLHSFLTSTISFSLHTRRGRAQETSKEGKVKISEGSGLSLKSETYSLCGRIGSRVRGKSVPDPQSTYRRSKSAHNRTQVHPRYSVTLQNRRQMLM